MKELKGIIFDLDNTLLDRTKTFGQFTTKFLQQYFDHVVETQALYGKIIDFDQDGYRDKTELFAQLIDEFPWKERPTVQDLMSFYEAEYVSSAVAMEHAHEVLSSLRGKYKTALITNGRTMIQYGKIDQLSMRDHFDAILVSEEAEVKKPDPQIFNMALERLQLSPEQCVYIGDHPVNDVEGAAAIGMNTIWIKVNQPWREHVKVKPLHTITKLDELLTIL